MGNLNSSEGQEDWVRAVISQLSPRFAEYASVLLVDEIEPLIQKILSKSDVTDDGGEEIVDRKERFRFESTDLGSTPPKISNIRVVPSSPEAEGNEIVLDFDVNYLGDCDLQVRILGIRGGVSDVQLEGKARLALKPTMSEMPFIGGFQLCFLDEPRINFDMEGLANICDWPLLRRKVRKEILEDIAKHGVYPNRLSLPLSSKANLKIVKNFDPNGILFIRINRCQNLPKKGGVRKLLGQGKPDCYVKVQVGSMIFFTKVIKNDCDPIWEENEWFEFPLENLTGPNLKLRLYDHDSMSRDEFMGKVVLPLESLDLDQESTFGVEGAAFKCLYEDSNEKSKYDEFTGEICFEAKWQPLTIANSNEGLNLEPRWEGQSTVAILNVFIHNCNNLVTPDEPSPTTRVAITLDGKTFRSDWEKKEVHPTFGFGANFKIVAPDLEGKVCLIQIEDKQDLSIRGEVQLLLTEIMGVPLEKKLLQLNEQHQTMAISVKISSFV